MGELLFSDKNRPKVFFRFDANSAIASGHLVRCATLMREFERRGYVTQAIVSDDESAHYARGRGLDPIVTGVDWRDLDQEVTPLREKLAPFGPESLLVVDTYSARPDYLSELSGIIRVCYLGVRDEDLGSLYALVDYGIRASREQYLSIYGSRGTRLLIGPSYAPLSEEFRGGPIEIREKVKRVLITTGGTDRHHITAGVLRELLAAGELQDVRFSVAVGAMFDNKEELEGEFGDSDRVELLAELNDLSGTMKHCDVCISACGTTVYELAALGVPSVVFPVSAEQLKSSIEYGRRGIAKSCLEGSIEALARSITRETIKLCASEDERLGLAQRARALVDGRGAERIVEELVSLSPGKGGI